MGSLVCLIIAERLSGEIERLEKLENREDKGFEELRIQKSGNIENRSLEEFLKFEKLQN